MERVGKQNGSALGLAMRGFTSALADDKNQILGIVSEDIGRANVSAYSMGVIGCAHPTSIG